MGTGGKQTRPNREAIGPLTGPSSGRAWITRTPALSSEADKRFFNARAR